MKIQNREDLNNIIISLKQNLVKQGALGHETEPKKSLKIGFTSGTFDILHTGHTEYLAKAKKQCDILIVGVNSDSSVKQYKDPLRPYNTGTDRIKVLSALESVDYVFLFDEKNNNKNIEELRPDIYFKGGDYSNKPLSSAGIVESYGGKVVLIPFEEGFSTTNIIDKIQKTTLVSQIQQIDYEPKPAVFLDRDGTIIEEFPYIHEKEKVKVIDGTIEALKKIKDNGYRIVVITNQPGIGMGYFTKEQFFEVNSEMLKILSKECVLIDKIYFCPHSKSDGCLCRKPATGMIDKAIKDLNIIVEKSFLFGDMTNDILLGNTIGCKSILVKTGKAGKDGQFEAKPDFVAENLKEGVEWILKGSQASVPANSNRKIL